jgi:hypothetical protein
MEGWVLPRQAPSQDRADDDHNEGDIFGSEERKREQTPLLRKTLGRTTQRSNSLTREGPLRRAGAASTLGPNHFD